MMHDKKNMYIVVLFIPLGKNKICPADHTSDTSDKEWKINHPGKFDMSILKKVDSKIKEYNNVKMFNWNKNLKIMEKVVENNTYTKWPPSISINIIWLSI